MHNKSIKELCVALEQGECTSEELTRHFLDRINSHDGELNSFITVTGDEAIAQARAADQRRQRGEAGTLTGVPIAHKDLFCTKGVKTSCGSKMLDNFISPYDATLVERMRDVGLVMLGKTNMDEFAMGSSNENSYYGPVRNPWSLQHVPGGSSGGSAAAVCARLAPVTTGTDTGGSVRQPAALCGVTGLKPTYGRVSRYGMVAFASSLDQAGLFARSAEDIALVLPSIAGFDERDSTSAQQPVEDYAAHLEAATPLRIGVPNEYFEDGLDGTVAAAIEAAIKVFQDMGTTVKPISLPSTRLAVPTYYVVSTSRVLIEFVALRWRTLWLQSRCAGGSGRLVQAFALGRFRCRSQTTHYGWHVCAVIGLLPRLLPESTKVAAADQSGFPAGVRRGRYHRRSHLTNGCFRDR